MPLHQTRGVARHLWVCPSLDSSPHSSLDAMLQTCLRGSLLTSIAGGFCIMPLLTHPIDGISAGAVSDTYADIERSEFPDRAFWTQKRACTHHRPWRLFETTLGMSRSRFDLRISVDHYTIVSVLVATRRSCNCSCLWSWIAATFAFAVQLRNQVPLVNMLLTYAAVCSHKHDELPQGR